MLGGNLGSLLYGDVSVMSINFTDNMVAVPVHWACSHCRRLVSAFIIMLTGHVIQTMFYQMSRYARKPVYGVSDLVQHKPGGSYRIWLEA